MISIIGFNPAQGRKCPQLRGTCLAVKKSSTAPLHWVPSPFHLPPSPFHFPSPSNVRIYTHAGTRGRVKKAPSYVVDLNPDNFNAIVKDPSKNVLVEFYAPCE